jgi:hypothetical protein
MTASDVEQTIPGAATRRSVESESRVIPQSRLAVARALWILIALVDAALFIASVTIRWERLHILTGGLIDALDELGMSRDGFATYNVALEITFALAFTSVAAIIFFRKHNDLPALFFSLMLFTFGTASNPVLPTIYALEVAQPAFAPLTRFMAYITWVTVFVFFCVFPDGRFVPRWSRWFAAFATLICIPWVLWPDVPPSPWTWPAPALVLFELGMWGTCIYMQQYRYRYVSNHLQRQQTRWVVFGMAVSVICILAFFLPRMINPELARPTDRPTLLYYLLSSTAIDLAALFTPLVIGISILRYRLWTIDPILNRALVYIPLTGILGGLYAASITLFQKIFVAFTGDKSDGAVIISTLILASMFTPVKNALQTAVDRRFKQPSDPAEKLEEFGEHIESVVQVFDIHSIARRLLDEAIEAFDATGGAIYLRRHVAELAHEPHEHVNSYGATRATGYSAPPRRHWQQQSGWRRRTQQWPPRQDSGRYVQPSEQGQDELREWSEQDRQNWARPPYPPRGIYADLQLVYKSEYWNGNTVIGVPLRLNNKRYGLLALGQRRNNQVYSPEDRERLKRVVDSVTDALVLESQQSSAREGPDIVDQREQAGRKVR